MGTGIQLQASLSMSVLRILHSCVFQSQTMDLPIKVLCTVRLFTASILMHHNQLLASCQCQKPLATSAQKICKCNANQIKSLVLLNVAVATASTSSRTPQMVLAWSFPFWMSASVRKPTLIYVRKLTLQTFMVSLSAQMSTIALKTTIRQQQNVQHQIQPYLSVQADMLKLSNACRQTKQITSNTVLIPSVFS